MLGVTVVSGILLFPPAASAASGGSSGAASLSVTGPNPFSAQLSSPSKTGSRSATIHPVILNTGTAPAYVTFSASLDVSDGNCTNPTITVASDQPTPITLAAGASAAPMLTMTMNQYCPGIDGTIIVMGGAGASPTSLRFALTNSVQESEYWYPIAAGLGAGILFLVVMLILVGACPGKFGKLGAVVATGSSWSFSSSWLTNITALGAVLGTVLGATGFLADVLPGTDTGRFTGLSVLFGAFVIALLHPGPGAGRADHQRARPVRPGTDSPDLVGAAGRIRRRDPRGAGHGRTRVTTSGCPGLAAPRGRGAAPGPENLRRRCSVSRCDLGARRRVPVAGSVAGRAGDGLAQPDLGRAGDIPGLRYRGRGRVCAPRHQFPGGDADWLPVVAGRRGGDVRRDRD